MAGRHARAQGSRLLAGAFVCLIPFISFGATAASLIGSAPTSTPATNNLTADGPADWVHWGLTTATSVNRKANVTPQISGITNLGTAPRWFAGKPENWWTHSWSDGTPTGSQGGFPGGIFFLDLGNGYTFTVPAGTASRTLKVYVGGYKSRSRIVVTLSDGSAAPYSTAFENLTGNYQRVVTLTFSAASNGQTLTFRHTFDGGAGGNIGLQAAALQGATNAAPTIDPIGNQSVAVDNALAFSVIASDADGPAPLAMTISGSIPALPAGASYTDNGNGTGSFAWTPNAANVGTYVVTFAATEAGAGLSAEQTITIRVSGGGGSASLVGSAPTSTPSSNNLTVDGPVDWVHWGLTTTSSVNRKANVTPQISGITPLGLAPSRFGGNPANWWTHRWSDGTPTASQGGFPGGIFFLNLGNGYTFTVPAGTTSRTLKVYVGGYKSRSRIDVTLSDGSAAPYSTTFENLAGNYQRVVTLTFSAASNGQALTFRHTFDAGAGGNIGLQAAALQGSTLPFVDDFNDGNFTGWTKVDQTNKASSWQVQSGELRELNRVESVYAFQQSFHLGTYLVYGGGSLWTNYRFTVIGTYLSTGLAEDIGVMFRYVDANNYYRLALNSRYGFTRLEKKVAGVFTTLASNSRGYRPNEALLFTVDVQGSVISVSVNGDPLFAVADSSIAAGTVALYTQDQAKFDNVVVDEPSAAPRVTIGSPIAYSTSSSDSINVTAYAANVPANGYVDFVLDGASSQSDTTAPFNAVFPSVAPGDHQVAAILRDQQGTELARDTNALVGSGGEDIVGIGDSITNGFGDVYATDNLAVAPRIVSFQGYAANLTAQLDTSQFSPANLVTNEGVGGDDTYKAAFVRIDSIKARHPTADRALILLGTNDSQAAIPSGLGCSGASCNGTLRGNLQTLIDKVRWADYPTNSVPSGVTPVVARVPPTWTATSPWNSATNNLIRSYNTAISTGLVGANLGPDFFSFFMPSSQPLTFRRTLFRDDLHPNALGYVVMATLWHNALNPSSPLPMPFLLDNFAVSAGAVEPQQNLIENGDPLYVGSGFLVSSIPALLIDGRWIKTSNVDKSNASASYISFSVDRPVQVYIAYDASASVRPAWLSSYVDTGLTIATDNPLTPTMRLYVKSFPSGPVVLGGNLQSPAVGANANFVAIVVPI